MSMTTDQIRNIAVAGHGGTGKTTLVEQCMVKGGIKAKPDTVESGKTVSDYTEEEIEKQFSIHTTLSHIKLNNRKINIFDTPGLADFVGEVVAAFRAAEAAVMVIDARSGVQIETLKLWRRLDKRGMPRFAFINMMDRDHASYEKSMDDLKEKFSFTFVPVTIPIGEAGSFKGIINLVEMKAYLIDDSGKETQTDIPQDMKDKANAYRDILIETAAEGDDELTEKYFDEGTLSTGEVRKGLMEGLAGNKFVPVHCGSALLGSGITSLMNFISHEAPSPVQINEPLMNEDKTVPITPKSDFSGEVFKTSIDQFSGRLSFVKVITGVLTHDMEVFNTHTDKKEKIGKLYFCEGKKLIETDEIEAGDVGVIAKIDTLATNTTLCLPGKSVRYLPLQIPHPVHSVAVNAGSKKEEDKLSSQLHKIAEQDPTFQVGFNTETKETVVSGMGELHINLILNKIKEQQNISIETRVPKIAYRETINKGASAEYTHKKQSGGHGQFGRVVLEVKPLPRGEQFAFFNDIKGGVISKGYIPGVEKGIVEAMEKGPVAGFPIVDIEAHVIDGKEHPVDSSEMSFKTASRGALYAAMENAGASLLEPVFNLSVFVDEQYMGDILADLSSRRGRVLGQEQIGGGLQEIKALVPHAELLRYSIDLKSITSGTASFEMQFDHYEPISGRIAQDVINASKEALEV